MRTLFRGGRVFDGSGAPLSDADLVIDDGRIVAVGTGLDGDEAIECEGKSLLPGLFDCHIHLMGRYEDDELTVTHRPFSYAFYAAPANLRTTLALGITTVRDAGGADLGLKRAVEDGVIPGPRMQIAVTMLSQTGGHNDPWLPSGGFFSPTDDPMHPHFAQDELDQIVRTAADLERPVMAHAHSPESIKRAVRAGVRSIEHGTYLDQESAEMMVERGTWLVPTLTAGDTTEELAKDPKLAPEIRAKFEGLGRPEFDAMQLAAEAGVKVAMGTDCPVAPHGWNLNELAHMAANGFTPVEALVAATSSAAELIGLEDRLGSLAPGKIADVVVVDGDPFEFPKLKDRIEQVWKDGVRVV